MVRACTGEEVLNYLQRVLRPTYASLEIRNRKGMVQACIGEEVLNYLHRVLKPIRLA